MKVKQWTALLLSLVLCVPIAYADDSSINTDGTVEMGANEAGTLIVRPETDTTLGGDQHSDTNTVEQTKTQEELDREAYDRDMEKWLEELWKKVENEEDDEVIIKHIETRPTPLPHPSSNPFQDPQVTNVPLPSPSLPSRPGLPDIDFNDFPGWADGFWKENLINDLRHNIGINITDPYFWESIVSVTVPGTTMPPTPSPTPTDTSDTPSEHPGPSADTEQRVYQTGSGVAMVSQREMPAEITPTFGDPHNDTKGTDDTVDGKDVDGNAIAPYTITLVQKHCIPGTIDFTENKVDTSHIKREFDQEKWDAFIKWLYDQLAHYRPDWNPDDIPDIGGLTPPPHDNIQDIIDEVKKNDPTQNVDIDTTQLPGTTIVVKVPHDTTDYQALIEAYYKYLQEHGQTSFRATRIKMYNINSVTVGAITKYYPQARFTWTISNGAESVSKTTNSKELSILFRAAGTYDIAVTQENRVERATRVEGTCSEVWYLDNGDMFDGLVIYSSSEDFTSDLQTELDPQPVSRPLRDAPRSASITSDMLNKLLFVDPDGNAHLPLGDFTTERG